MRLVTPVRTLIIVSRLAEDSWTATYVNLENYTDPYVMTVVENHQTPPYTLPVGVEELPEVGKTIVITKREGDK